MKKLIITLIVLAVLGGSVFAYYKYGRPEEVTKFSYLGVTRGDVTESVGATGTIQAVRTVMVGSQVSGQIKSLRNVDFNSIVQQGQVIAELDPSLFQTQVEQAKANLTRSETDRDRLRITLEDSRNKLARTQSLFDRKIATQQDLETAAVNVKSAEAQLKSSEASIVQSQASLNQSQVSLDHTIITAPITGIVISRNVDVGQTVAASMNAPTIFIIAGDLTQLQVIASVSESDVGRIRPNQVVRFRVDAFPGEEFFGSVSQVRLNPIVSQNVVTYATVIDVPNPLLKLKLGMTAVVTIEIAKKTNVLRVPNAALRYRPTKEIFDELKLPVPPELLPRAPGARGAQGPGGGARGQANNDSRGQAGAAPATTPPVNPAARPAPAAGAAAPGVTEAPTPRANRQPGEAGEAGQQGGGRQRMQGDQAAGGQGGGGGRGGARQSMQERMASMTPAEREAFIARMKERGIDPNNPGANRGGGRGGGGMAGGQPGRAGNGQRGGATAGQPAQGIAALAAAKPGSQTIDQLFGALPPTRARGRAWIYAAGQLKAVQLTIGISDGTWTELLSEELQEGQQLVTNIVTPAMAAAAAARPTMGQPQNQQQGRGANPFQGGGGGGRGRG